MKNVKTYVSFLISALILLSCSDTTFIFDGRSEDQWSLKKSPSYSIVDKSLDAKTKGKNHPPKDILPILDLDRIQALVIKTTKARDSVDLVGTARKYKTTATSNFGLAPNLDDALRSGADVSFNVEKALVDQGQIGLEEQLAILAYEQSLLDLRIAIDKEIGRSLKAQSELAKFTRLKSIFDHYEKIYEEQKPLLEASWKSGVIGRSDINKIEQARMKLLKGFALYNLEAERASNTLFDIYGSNWKKFKSENVTFDQLDALNKKILTKSPLMHSLNLRSKTVKVNKEILKVENKWKARLRGNINIPVSANPEPTSFLGVTVSLPIEDGGANEIEQGLLDEDLLELEKQSRSLEQKFSSGFKQWEIFSTYQKEHLRLLNSEYKILDEILADLELKRKTGRVSLQDYVIEIMKKAELEISIIIAGQESVEQAMSFMSEVSLSCEFIDRCSQLSSIENWLTYGR